MQIEKSDGCSILISQKKIEYDVSNNLQRYFIYGNYIDEPLIMNDTSNDYYYAHDHLYSTAALKDTNGDVVERYEYDAYGNCHVLDPDFSADADGLSDYDNPYTFTGRRIDILDGGDLVLMYYRYRTYSPQLGRFLQHDPLGIVPNSAFGPPSQYRLDNQPFPDEPIEHITIKEHNNSMNLYQFVYNRPISMLDPHGLEPNGCGSVGSEWVDDDPWWAGGANFKPACDNHDLCYEGNGPGGCHASRRDCDREWLSEMRNACRKKYSWWRPGARTRCYQVANLYYAVVRAAGKNAFNRARAGHHCDSCGSTPGPPPWWPRPRYPNPRLY